MRERWIDPQVFTLSLPLGQEAFPVNSHDPAATAGKPCTRVLRITVGIIVGLMARRSSREPISEAYPLLVPADIVDMLVYTAWRMEEQHDEWMQLRLSAY